MAAVFNHPFTCIVAGPTGSGKTQFCKRVIENVNGIVNPTPQKIVWRYGVIKTCLILLIM